MYSLRPISIDAEEPSSNAAVHWFDIEVVIGATNCPVRVHKAEIRMLGQEDLNRLHTLVTASASEFMGLCCAYSRIRNALVCRNCVLEAPALAHAVALGVGCEGWPIVVRDRCRQSLVYVHDFVVGLELIRSYRRSCDAERNDAHEEHPQENHVGNVGLRVVRWLACCFLDGDIVRFRIFAMCQAFVRSSRVVAEVENFDSSNIGRRSSIGIH